MILLRSMRIGLVVVSMIGCFLHSVETFGQTAQTTPRDGQHDFDFGLGIWKTHIKRLQHPLSGSNSWVEYEGISAVRKVWNGRSSLGETEADGPAGHLELLSLRLYNPQARQWVLTYSSSKGGTLSVPSQGEFKNGRGEFYDSETLNGRGILVRQVWSDITPSSCHFEQAYSDDGGKTWEVNWSAVDTRVSDAEAPKTAAQPGEELAGQHDFDFQIGSWKPRISRLKEPLTGSTQWMDYEGKTVVSKIWNGRANLVELEADGPAGHLEIMCLRLYNPATHQWNLNYANSTDGTPSPAVIGSFKDGRGEFYGADQLNDKPIYVRNVISDGTGNSFHFEQAFSSDGGKTWELNFVETMTRANADER